VPRSHASEAAPADPVELTTPIAPEDDDGRLDHEAAGGAVGVPMRPRRRRLARRLLVGLAAVLALLVGYYGFCLYQVWHTARTDAARPADAIVVLGAAQYNGRPSPVLAARLDHALLLWQHGYAKHVVVTGGKQPGDRYTEATASADYLIARGVPDAAILREVKGHNTWDSLAATARILRDRDLRSVLIVSDPYRVRGSSGWAEWKRMFKEAAGVGVARFIGYRRLLQISG